ncbi:MAG: hypothetical protein M0009_03900 [Deltaproteobacteria bacterium]|nr:hypothetical protein [Deltaproteobacteria bacterium]
MNTKLSIVLFALFGLAASAGVALAESSYEVRWYESASCIDKSKCACSEVSGYVKGSEAAKQTIAPLANQSWQSMAVTNTNLNPLAACTMVLTAVNCGYYACKTTSPTTSQCGYWTESASAELPCGSGRAYVEYYTNTGFRVNFQTGFF